MKTAISILKRFCKNGKYGYMDISGLTVIPPQSNHAYDFSEGLAIVDALFPFCEGMALYSNNGKWGYLNTDIKVAIEAQYYGAGLFSEGVAPVTCEGEIRNKHGWYIERDGVSSVSDMQ